MSSARVGVELIEFFANSFYLRLCFVFSVAGELWIAWALLRVPLPFVSLLVINFCADIDIATVISRNVIRSLFDPRTVQKFKRIL